MGKTLNVTGDAQVRFLLACQPCNYYANPRPSGIKSKPPSVQGEVARQRRDGGVVKR